MSSNVAISTDATVRLDGVLRDVSFPGECDAQATPDPRQITAQVSEQLEADRRQLALAKAALEKAAEQFVDAQAEFFQAAEEQMLDLAIEIARKILAQEIDAGKYKIDPIISEAMAGVSSRSDVVVHLNVDDLAQCELAANANRRGEGSDSIRFVADMAVGRGECVIETPHGEIASSVDSQLAEIGQALKNPE